MTGSEAAAEGAAPGNRRHFNARRSAWAAVALIFAVSLVLSAMTVLNYAEIAKAAVLTEVVTEQAALLHYNASGGLESVEMVLDFTIANPSGKELKAWIITYKGWVRDLPAEQGVDNSRWRVDGQLIVNDTEQVYFPVFATSYSFDQPDVPVPPNSNITLSKRLFMNRSEYPDIMEGFEAILDQTSGQGLELEWLSYTAATILIRDIPSYSGPNHDANVIKRYEGIDITPGVGGAGR
jgi:hypothetical protein